MCNDFDAQIETKQPERVMYLQGVTETFKIHIIKSVSATPQCMFTFNCVDVSWMEPGDDGGGGQDSGHVIYLTVVLVDAFHPYRLQTYMPIFFNQSLVIMMQSTRSCTKKLHS